MVRWPSPLHNPHASLLADVPTPAADIIHPNGPNQSTTASALMEVVVAYPELELYPTRISPASGVPPAAGHAFAGMSCPRRYGPPAPSPLRRSSSWAGSRCASAGLPGGASMARGASSQARSGSRGPGSVPAATAWSRASRWSAGTWPRRLRRRRLRAGRGSRHLDGLVRTVHAIAARLRPRHRGHGRARPVGPQGHGRGRRGRRRLRAGRGSSVPEAARAHRSCDRRPARPRR